MQLVALVVLAMTFAAQRADAVDPTADRNSPGPYDDFGEAESDGSPSIPYHAFLDKFKSRIDHSPIDLTHREVFDAVR